MLESTSQAIVLRWRARSPASIRRIALTPEEDEHGRLVDPGEVGDVDRDRVHRDDPDDGRSPSVHEDGRPGLRGASVAVAVADGQDRDARLARSACQVAP